MMTEMMIDGGEGYLSEAEEAGATAQQQNSQRKQNYPKHLRIWIVVSGKKRR